MAIRAACSRVAEPPPWTGRTAMCLRTSHVFSSTTADCAGADAAPWVPRNRTTTSRSLQRALARPMTGEASWRRSSALLPAWASTLARVVLTMTPRAWRSPTRSAEASASPKQGPGCAAAAARRSRSGEARAARACSAASGGSWEMTRQRPWVTVALGSPSRCPPLAAAPTAEMSAPKESGDAKRWAALEQRFRRASAVWAARFPPLPLGSPTSR
mmetsp:Transcript_31005/g.90088  ORF Transcript_31005/g.90088 Transcript_31005/m.90088 type:complete len:215 (-) Transcript_31005:1764-2408(-)